MKLLRTLLALTLAAGLTLATQAALGQGNSQGKGNGNAENRGKGFGRSMNIGVGNASDGIMGRILTGRDVFYTGDPLSIRIIFPRGADLISEGLADAYVVVFAPSTPPEDTGDEDNDDTNDNGDDTSDTDTSNTNGTAGVLTDAVVLPVNEEASAEARVLFGIDAVDVSALPAGTYQLGLILTNPGGDPLVINDWYGGLLGLVHVRGLTVAAEAVDFDSDGDGMLDDDSDGDGFSDVEEDVEEEGSSDDDSGSDP